MRTTRFAGRGLGGLSLVVLSLAVLLGAHSHPAESAGPGQVFRLTSAPLAASRGSAGGAHRGSWTSTAGPVTLDLVDDGAGTMRVAAGNAAPITVRRANATGSRPVMEDDTLVVRDASPGVDSMLFAVDVGIEELLFVKEPGAELRYDLDLPKGFTLRQTKAFPRSVEVLRPGGTPLLRFVADKAWDAGGRDVELQVSVEGSRIEVSFDSDAPLPVVVDPTWIHPGFLNASRIFHAATLLSNGKVVFSGHGTAELFDPLTGTFEQVPQPMLEDRAAHTATLLLDGKVLVAGGEPEGTDSVPHATTEVYDPVTDSLALGPTMAVAHVFHTATLLDDGAVLISSGSGGTLAERYEPSSQAFVSAGDAAFGSFYHTATRLADGKVLFRQDKMAQIYDPGLGAFLPEVTLESTRAGHSATLLPGGDVFFAGGFWLNDFSSEIYDPVSGAGSAGPLAVLRAGHAASLLPAGDVLLAACSQTLTDAAQIKDPCPACIGPCTQSAELFSPSTGQAVILDPIPHSEDFPTSTLLPDGTAFVIGVGVVPAIYRPAAQWTATDDVIDHYLRVAIPLRSGLVLLAGWSGAYLYDPASATLSGLIPGSENIHVHEGVALPDGRALLTSGDAPDLLVYDPSGAPQGSIVVVGQLPTARKQATATLLPDRTVLIAGGYVADATASSAADLFLPGTGEIVSVGDMTVPRGSHSAIRLPDGRVFLAGGPPFQEVTGSAEVYDPVAREFAPLPEKMKTGMSNHSALVLPNGQVLLVGGGAAQVFDPDTGQFEFSAGQVHPYRHGGVIAPPSRALLFGTTEFQLYDYLADVTETLAEMSGVDGMGAALLMPSGDVLSTFSKDLSGTPVHTLRIWHDATVPPTVPRPVLSSAPKKVTPGQTVDIAGSTFTGVSEGSSATFGSSASNFPVPVWVPWPQGNPSWGTATEWSAQKARWTVPPTDYPGLGLLFMVVNGISSNGVLVEIEPAPPGAACVHGPGCASGSCIDGVCCESACVGCESCAEPMTGLPDGVCGPRIDPTTAEGACCDGGSTLELPGGDTEDCGEYRCPAGASKCATECASNADCRAGKVCSTEHECENPVSAEIVRGCSACSTGGKPREGGALFMLGLALGVLRVRRRSRDWYSMTRRPCE